MILSVETNGSFLNATVSDMKARGWRRPTKLNLLGYKLSPGDWIGVSCLGEYGYGPGHGSNNHMIGAFLDKNGTRLMLGPGSNYRQPPISPTNADKIPFDLSHCFGIPPGSRIFLRIPSNATHLTLCAPDNYWSDNTSKKYSIEITEPNKDPKDMFDFNENEDLNSADEYDACYGEWQDSFESAYGSTLNETLTPVVWADSPLIGEGKAPMQPQFRGWYNRWAPKASDHGSHPQRGGNMHYGWDIFYPVGTPIVAPAVPCFVDVIGHNHPDLGDFIQFTILHDKVTYKVIYAHLSIILVTNELKISDAKQIVGHTGCTGNARAGDGARECGVDLLMKKGHTPDKRRDHLHVNLFKPKNPKNEYINPNVLFNYNPI